MRIERHWTYLTDEFLTGMRSVNSFTEPADSYPKAKVLHKLPLDNEMTRWPQSDSSRAIFQEIEIEWTRLYDDFIKDIEGHREVAQPTTIC